MIITDEYILNEFFSKSHLYTNKKTFTEDVKQYLRTRYSDCFRSYKETIYRIKLHIDTVPLCQVCGKPCAFNGKSNGIYLKYCSNDCKKKNHEETAKRLKQTKIERYNNENYVNPLKAKQTKMERYGDAGYRDVEKTKQTCLLRYGVDNVRKSPIIKEKIKQIKLECYGYENTFCNAEIQHRAILLANTEEAKKKIKNTCLLRYGVTHFNKLETSKSRLSIVNSSKEVVQKRTNTAKRNGSFKQSKQEEEVYNLLIEKYGVENVKRQHSSNLYPYNCDFYIIPNDLYIECNFHWSHGGHPYNKDTDNIKLAEMQEKSKTSRFFVNAINTWTIRDVNKRNTAIENKLNYKELWNIHEAKEWINSL